MKQAAVSPLFTVIDASCTYLDKSNPFGIAVGGRLTVRGQLLRATITPSTASTVSSDQPATAYAVRHGGHELVFHPDTNLGPVPPREGRPAGWAASDEVVLLAGSRGQTPLAPEITCICLRQSGRGSYVRFGVAALASLKSLDIMEAFYAKFSAPQEVVIE